MKSSALWACRRPKWGLLVVLLSFAAPTAAAEDTPIRVGILHSLSGTMAISEAALKDTVLMLIEDQNRKGGLLGRKLEPVVVNPNSDWDLFAEKSRELLAKEKVAVVFGCWTSASRKSVLPVFEELNGLLYYPVQYEGEESSRNIFYTGAAPNQQAIPAVRYLMSKEGGDVRRWVLLGTDYVYPRTTNRILSAYLAAEGVSPDDITTIYTPFGYSEWRGIVERIKAFGSEGKKTAVISTGRRQRNSSHGILHRRARIAGRGHFPRRAPGSLELLPLDQLSRKQNVHQNVDGLQRATRQNHKRPDGGHLHWLQDVGASCCPSGHHRRRCSPAGHVRSKNQGAERLRGCDEHQSSSFQASHDRQNKLFRGL
jgi:hypothetical protein